MWVGKWIRKCLWHAMAHVFSAPGTTIASWPRLVVALSDARLLARLVFYGELSEGTEREAGYVAHFSLDILSTEHLWAFALCRIMPKQRICPFKPGPSKKRLFHTPRIFKPKIRTKLWKRKKWIGVPGFVSCASGTLWVGADYLLGSLWALAVLDGGEGPQSAPWLGCNWRDAAFQTSWMPMMVEARSWQIASFLCDSLEKTQVLPVICGGIGGGCSFFQAPMPIRSILIRLGNNAKLLTDTNSMAPSISHAQCQGECCFPGSCLWGPGSPNMATGFATVRIQLEYSFAFQNWTKRLGIRSIFQSGHGFGVAFGEALVVVVPLLDMLPLGGVSCSFCMCSEFVFPICHMPCIL